MNFGRKLFFNKSDGFIFFEIQEQRNVFGLRKTTIDDDIKTFKALSERSRETFDVIELEYGQFAQDFAECNGYRINPQTKEIEFSYPDPNQPEQPPVYQKPMSEQIKSLELQQKQTNDDLSSLMDFIITGGM